MSRGSRPLQRNLPPGSRPRAPRAAGARAVPARAGPGARRAAPPAAPVFRPPRNARRALRPGRDVFPEAKDAFTLDIADPLDSKDGFVNPGDPTAAPGRARPAPARHRLEDHPRALRGGPCPGGLRRLSPLLRSDGLPLRALRRGGPLPGSGKRGADRRLGIPRRWGRADVVSDRERTGGARHLAGGPARGGGMCGRDPRPVPIGADPELCRRRGHNAFVQGEIGLLELAARLAGAPNFSQRHD